MPTPTPPGIPSPLPTDRPVRWGILATGKITDSFVADLLLVPDAEFTAVGSRSMESAQRFADSHRRHDGTIARTHGTYADLLADAEVDVVYVATPHGRHVEDVLACFEAGKNVLCEKAITLNARDGAMLVAAARRRQLFFAEAMWMRCNPNIVAMRRMVAGGVLGNVLQVRADLGFVGGADIARLWDPALGAGSLLDIGIYPLTFAYLMLGRPVDVTASATLSTTAHPAAGIDLNGGALLTYADGAMAHVSWTQVAHSDNRASISGDQGRIEVPARMHEPVSFERFWNSGSETVSEPVTGLGYAHEIGEVGECLRAGRTESDLLPPDETVAILALMDEIRAQVGVEYAADAGA